MSYGIGDIVRYEGKRYRIEGWIYQKVYGDSPFPGLAPRGKIKSLILFGSKGKVHVSPPFKDKLILLPYYSLID